RTSQEVKRRVLFQQLATCLRRVTVVPGQLCGGFRDFTVESAGVGFGDGVEVTRQDVLPDASAEKVLHVGAQSGGVGGHALVAVLLTPLPEHVPALARLSANGV